MPKERCFQQLNTALCKAQEKHQHLTTRKTLLSQLKIYLLHPVITHFWILVLYIKPQHHIYGFHHLREGQQIIIY